jgi:outer membrane immunogenic protein
MRHIHLKALLAAIASIGLSGIASAADLPARTYTKAPIAPVETFNWTGFYIGGNVGGAWANTRVTDVNGFASSALPGTVTSLNNSGFLGGGQIGYNWQMGAWVFGLEADGGWMDIGGRTLLTGTTSNTMVGLRSAGYGDITGRLGWAFDRSLLYVKGGFAAIDNTATFSTLAPFAASLPSSNTGYAVGAGWEYKITHNLSAKVEYLHFDFGHTLNYSLVPGTFPFNQSLRVETVKVGLNYQFGGPIVAKY